MDERTSDDHQSGSEPFAAPAAPATPATQRSFMPEETAAPIAPSPAPTPAYSTPAPAAPAGIPAGWYPDPHDATAQRYWDGSAWQARQTPSFPEPAPRRRLARGTIAAIVTGSVVLVVGLVAAVAVLFPYVEEAALAAANGGSNARSLDAELPADWETIPVMDGAATVAIDPDWEDVSEYVDTASIEAMLSAEAEIDIRAHGTWLTSGDIWAGGTGIDIFSIADAGGPSSARLEANAYMVSMRTDFEDVATTSEGPVRTEHGYQGYVIEFESPLYGDLMVNTVGIVVDGHRQLLVQTSGLSASGSGVESMEAVLDSLVIE